MTGWSDIARLASFGLRSRRLRSALTVAGITVGIAAMGGVLGISESSSAHLLSVLDRLGTNLLTVTAGPGIGGTQGGLPSTAASMVGRIQDVSGVAGAIETQATVRRTDKVSPLATNGLSVVAAEPSLLATLGATTRVGTFLNQATDDYPVVVLGSVAALRLGIIDLETPRLVWLGDRWFTVIGILQPLEALPSIDRAALVGIRAAHDWLHVADALTIIYVRVDPTVLDEVRRRLPATANPEHPDQVRVDRPSDALAARAAAATSFTALLVGLGGVALLVGGIGIANAMLMSVLERRSEIGLRRALGATRRGIMLQFLSESLLLGLLGGLLGVVAGALLAAGFARIQDWPLVISGVGVAGGLTAALAIGGLAGLYPARRAASITPTEALRST